MDSAGSATPTIFAKIQGGQLLDTCCFPIFLILSSGSVIARSAHNGMERKKLMVSFSCRGFYVWRTSKNPSLMKRQCPTWVDYGGSHLNYCKGIRYKDPFLPSIQGSVL